MFPDNLPAAAAWLPEWQAEHSRYVTKRMLTQATPADHLFLLVLASKSEAWLSLIDPLGV